MSYVDALSQIDQIQTQLASLQSAFIAPAATSGSGTTGASSTSGGASADVASSASFADMLAGAGGTGASTGAMPTTATTATPMTATPTTATTLPTAAGTTGATGSATLPAAASTMLTSGQQTFAARLAADTGLDPGVVSAWLLAEESGGAAVSRQSAGNNDWLNIGYTGAGTYGSGDAIWSNPVTAADATAGWLKGQDTIPGYGTASSGIQGILQTVGQAPSAQISALQTSGWAGSGYPDLPSLYAQVAG